MTQQIILFINPDDSTAHKASANASIYPNLGLLTIMSALAARLDSAKWKLAYLDGTVVGNGGIHDFILKNGPRISALCVSVLTSNYGAGLRACKYLKEQNPSALCILGNDHFSALYSQILTNRKEVDYGFSGNDVVSGFANFLFDALNGQMEQHTKYPGLVYRNKNGGITQNPEDPSELSALPLVNYNLMDFPHPHREHYLLKQRGTYLFMREMELTSMVVDIGRGCIKFSGPRTNGIPLNACDFCAIIPGTKAIAFPTADRAWNIFENCFRSGFNYFYVTADELPLTFWPLLKAMAENPPAWFSQLPEDARPRMFGYTRAEAFVRVPERIDVLVDKLRFNHFFIGFDGLSDISLRVMNKQPVGHQEHDLMWHNMQALNRAVEKKCYITGGIVLTHLGITPAIMEANFRQLEVHVDRFPKAFAALDFGPLCPIPGSHAFEYFKNPAFTEEKARSFGLRVDRNYLESISHRYQNEDLFQMDGLIQDFVVGCCPDISMQHVENYLQKTTELAKRHGIVVGGGV